MVDARSRLLVTSHSVQRWLTAFVYCWPDSKFFYVCSYCLCLFVILWLTQVRGKTRLWWPAVVLLHLKPFTRDESSGLLMITVDHKAAVVIVKRILFNVLLPDCTMINVRCWLVMLENDDGDDTDFVRLVILGDDIRWLVRKIRCPVFWNTPVLVLF